MAKNFSVSELLYSVAQLWQTPDKSRTEKQKQMVQSETLIGDVLSNYERAKNDSRETASISLRLLNELPSNKVRVQGEITQARCYKSEPT